MVYPMQSNAIKNELGNYVPNNRDKTQNCHAI